MPSLYPGALDDLPTNVDPNTKEDAPGLEHDVLHNRLAEAINAVQALLGTGAPVATVLARLAALEAGGGGGGGGDFVRIAYRVTTGSQAVVTFPSIPGTFRNLEIRVLGRGTAAATEANGSIRFNGDTGNNYDSIRENRFGTSNAVSVSRIDAFSIAGANSPAGTASPVTISIPNYSGSVFHKSLTAVSAMKQANSVANLFMQTGSGFWRNAAPISQIDLALQAGNWADGSVVSLYGLN